MGNWEFFIQKVGDQYWSQLETSQPKFPNGRYSIATRAAHRANEVIEVKISTYPTKESLEKTPQKHHACQLDRDGFGILAHKIRLTPGIWEIQCHGDLLSELMGENWQITLTLSVDWRIEPIIFDSPRDQTTTIDEDLKALRSRLDQNIDTILQELVTELFPTLPPSHPDPITSQTENEESEYSLQLDEDILIAQTNKPIIVSGQITTQKQPPHPKLRLKIILRDPRTGEIAAQLFPRLPNQPFPLIFCYSLSLPASCDSYLLQGEIFLCEISNEHKGKIFAHQPFTVNANWETLEPLLREARTNLKVSHPPAPLSPLSPNDSRLLPPVAPRSRGVFPPKLSQKRNQKRDTPPRLPKLPNATATKPKEYVWSKPEEDNETATSLQWELVEELVIVSTDKTEET